MKKKAVTLIIIAICLLGTNVFAAEPGEAASPSESGSFDIPDVVITTRDASQVQELEKQSLSPKVKTYEKEHPTVVKDSPVLLTPGDKEIPLIDTRGPGLLQTLNNLKIGLGSPYRMYHFFHGQSRDNYKYYIGIDHVNEVHGRVADEVEQDEISGSLSTVLGVFPVDLKIDHKRFSGDIPGYKNQSFSKSHTAISAGSSVALDGEDAMALQMSGALASQKVSANSLQAVDVETVLTYRTTKYLPYPLLFTSKVGRLGSGDPYWITSIDYEHILSAEDTISVGLESSSYLFPRVKYNRDMSDKVAAWVQYRPSVIVPYKETYSFSGPYTEITGPGGLAARESDLEAGLWIRHSKDLSSRLKLYLQTVADAHLLYDSNGDNLVEYHNGTKLQVMGFEVDAVYFIKDNLKLEAKANLASYSSDDVTGNVAPYSPGFTGSAELTYILAPNITWKTILNGVSGRYADLTGKTVPGYFLINTVLESEFTDALKGFFVIDNLLDGDYELYDGVSGKSRTVYTGISLNF